MVARVRRFPADAGCKTSGQRDAISGRRVGGAHLNKSGEAEVYTQNVNAGRHPLEWGHREARARPVRQWCTTSTRKCCDWSSRARGR